MIEIGSRRRSQPAAPHVVFEASSDPDRDPTRAWFDLLDDERRPRIISSDAPSMVTWSSLWVKRPDAVVRFELLSDGGSGTDLRWTLWVDCPAPSEALVGHLRKRLNEFVNANLRYTFGR